MYNHKTILALILARGGSKRLPGKNMKPIGGKPMIAWTVAAAKNSKYIDRIILSTDSNDIASAAQNAGAEIPFKRPPELATDTASAIDVALHAINWLKDNERKHYDYLLLLQPTSPLRTSAHIDEATEQLMERLDLDAIVSFTTWDKKPDWVYGENTQGFLEPCLDIKEPFSKTTPFFVLNGDIYIIKTESFLKNRTFCPQKLGHYLMKKTESVDIDTQEDFDVASLLMGKRQTAKKSIFIDKHEVNEGKEVFIIAEAGVNHNGSLEKALELIDLAADIGADAVKFQTFKAEQVVVETGEMADYQKKNMGVVKSQRDMLRELELPESFYPPLIERCRQKSILFLSTPHGGIESVRFLESLNTAAYKVGSGDLTNYLLLDALASTSKPIILSTGMGTLEEVKNTVEFIKSKGNDQIIVLHCTSNYPCPAKDVNMAAMKTLMRELDTPVGYSDHTEGIEAAIMATALGQALYEFHFTLDKSLPGPDHIASSSPEEARERINAIRKTFIMMGRGIKEPTLDEKTQTLPIARRSLVAARDLKKDHILIKEDLEAKRPCNGLSPMYFEKIIGKTLKRDYKKDEPIHLMDVG